MARHPRNRLSVKEALESKWLSQLYVDLSEEKHSSDSEIQDIPQHTNPSPWQKLQSIKELLDQLSI
jgi:hypothetical protein